MGEPRELVEAFASAAEAHGQFQDERANKHADQVAACAQQLREKAPGLQALEPLLEDSRASVRAWAATYLLDVMPDRAREVLTDLSKDQSVLGFSAETTLVEWEAGRLKLP